MYFTLRCNLLLRRGIDSISFILSVCFIRTVIVCNSKLRVTAGGFSRKCAILTRMSRFFLGAQLRILLSCRFHLTFAGCVVKINIIVNHYKTFIFMHKISWSVIFLFAAKKNLDPSPKYLSGANDKTRTRGFMCCTFCSHKFHKLGQYIFMIVMSKTVASVSSELMSPHAESLAMSRRCALQTNLDLSPKYLEPMTQRARMHVLYILQSQIGAIKMILLSNNKYVS